MMWEKMGICVIPDFKISNMKPCPPQILVYWENAQ